MINSFAMQKEQSHQQREKTRDLNTLTQTSHFPKGTSRVQNSPNPKENKENVNRQPQEIQHSDSGLYLLSELSENVKLDESIVEDDLSLYQRLTYPKWQIRRKTYIQLTEDISKDEWEEEFQQGWLKNIVQERTELAFNEALKFIKIYTKQQQINQNVLTFFIPDLVERGSFLKANQQSTVCEILLSCFKHVNEQQFIVQEVLKKIDSKHPKIIQFALILIKRIFKEIDHLNNDQLKQTIRYSTQLLKHTNKEIRSNAIELFGLAYCLVEESFDTLKNIYLTDLRSVQLRELSAICQKMNKKVVVRLKQEPEIVIPQKIVYIDLHSLLPDKYFEVPYQRVPGQKKEKIEQFAKSLEKTILKGSEVDPNKDYGTIFSVLVHVLEDSNILLYQEALKCVRCVTKLLGKNLQPSIARLMFHLVLEKTKGSLSKQHQSAIFSVLEDLLLYQSISLDSFLEMILNEIEQGRNMGVRISCVRWLKDGWLALAFAVQQGTINNIHDTQQQILRTFIFKQEDKIMKSLLVIYKKVHGAMKKEYNLNFKKACQELLICMQQDEQTNQVHVMMDIPFEQSSPRPKTSGGSLSPNRQEQSQNHLKRPQTSYNDSIQRLRTEEELNEFMKSHSPKPQFSQSPSLHYETPKTKKLNYSDSQSNNSQESDESRKHLDLSKEMLQLILEQIKQTNDLETLIKFLEQMKTLSTSNSVTFLSPNSRSPSGHWRRGMGRDNMIIPPSDQRGSWRSTPSLKVDDFKGVMDYCCINFNEAIAQQVYVVMINLKGLFPQQLAVFTHYIFQYISPSPIENTIQKSYLQQFMRNFFNGVAPNLLLSLYKQVFNSLLVLEERESLVHNSQQIINQDIGQRIVTMVQNTLPILLYDVLNDQPDLKQFSYLASTLIFMLTAKKLKSLSEEILNKLLSLHARQKIQEIIEIELIPFRKLYLTFSDWFDRLDTSRNLLTETIEELNKHHSHTESNHILVKENFLDQSLPTESIIEDDIKKTMPNPPQFQAQASFGYKDQQVKQDNQVTVDLLQFNEDQQQTLQGVKSNSTFNFSRSNYSQHLQLPNNEDFASLDLMNLPQIISPLGFGNTVASVCSPLQDTLFNELTKQLHTQKDVIQETSQFEKRPKESLLEKVNSITQLNESFQHEKRERYKVREEDDKTKYQQQQQPQPQPQAQTQKQPYLLQNKLQQKSQHLNTLISETQISSNESIIQKNKSHLNADDIQKLYQDVKLQTSQLGNNASQLQVPLAEQSISLMKPTKRNECVKHEILLTSTSLYFDIASTLLSHYEEITTIEEKCSFVEDLKLSIVNETLLQHISDTNYSVVIAIVLRLCTAPATQCEIYSASIEQDENELTIQLQLILDVLLRANSINQVLICLFRVLTDHLPHDFNCEISKNDKMMLRLTLKCIERLVQATNQFDEVDVFSQLVEVYKFFKFHPPENLVEGLPSIKELEYYFRMLKQITDKFVHMSPVRAKEFVEFVYQTNKKNIFLEYLKNSVEKILTL